MAQLKSTNLNLRISPEVREALREAAERDHRSVSNMVEYLIVQHCKLYDIPLEQQEKRKYKNVIRIINTFHHLRVSE